MPNDDVINAKPSEASRTLEELRNRERELSDFIENASVGLHWVGADGTILWANQAELDLLGYTREEYVGRHIAEFHADRDAIKDILNRLMNKETLHNYEARLKCKDGTFRHVLINSNVMWEDERFVHTRCFTRDITERKRAEEELYKSRKQLESVFNNATLALFILDARQHCTYMNPAAEKLTGYTLADVMGRPLHYFVHHTHPDGTPYPLEECPIDRAFPQNNQEQGEEIFIHKDGSFYPVAFTASPIREEGATVGTIIEVRDITREKQAEREREALLAREQTARAEAERQRDFTHHVIESAPIAIGVMEGPQHRFVLVNGQTCELTGLTEEQLIGRPHAEVVPEADKVVGPILDRVYTTGVAETQEIEVNLPKGRRHLLVTWTALPGSNGRPASVLYLSLDITERKEAEELLRESTEQYQATFEKAGVGIGHTAVDGRWLRVNQKLCDILGYTREEMLQLTFTGITHPDDLHASAAAVRQLLSGELQTYSTEKRYVHKDGSEVWANLTVSPLRDAAGGLKYFISVIEDISGRKRAEEERARLLESEHEARKQAEESSRLKDEFLATVSHELRTPLTAVLGWAHLLRSGQLDEKKAESALETIERNARSQAQLIDDLLDVSRIVTGSLRLDVRRVDPASIIEAAIEALRPAAEAKGVRLQKVMDTGVGMISGDPSRLQQVVWNLLANAVKFTPRGGRVQVLLERVNSHLEIVVSDTGTGISPEFLPFVFDRFRQADQTTTRHHGGLGLGLAIVRHLVEMHGGNVRADSPGEGQGATFTVTLPLISVYRNESGPEHVHPAARDAHLSLECPERLDGLRILVVDDEADTRELLEAVLGQCGAKVTTAASADEALRLLERELPDVLVSDIGMPDADGYELIKNVRALPAARGGRIPALALTAYARTEDRLRAVRSGYQMHISKPVEVAELVAIVASLVERSGSA